MDRWVIENRGLMDRFFAIATISRKGGRPLIIVSAYFKYSVPFTFFIDRLNSILERVGDRILIGADVNVHSPYGTIRERVTREEREETW